ncbi:hypothetical protein [Agromyces bauzanensis]
MSDRIRSQTDVVIDAIESMLTSGEPSPGSTLLDPLGFFADVTQPAVAAELLDPLGPDLSRQRMVQA